ncbi:Nn.00g042430.m01.CDS01 [Neocucurbitaria sp. VM-36]
MKYSGLYFIPNPSTNLDTSLNTVTTLIQAIETTFQTASRQPPWTLSYRVFRDMLPRDYTPSTDADGKPKPYPHTYQHILHHSSYGQSRSYICIQPPSGGEQGKGTVAAIPARQQDSYATLVRYQQAALWTPRHVLSVQGGATYTTGGLCDVQVGELRATREGPQAQSGAVQSPGVVVCISTVVRADTSADGQDAGEKPVENGTVVDAGEAIDFEYAQTVIRDCWQRLKEGRDLGRSEVREVMMAQEEVHGVREKEAAIRMWSEVLRLRG